MKKEKNTANIFSKIKNFFVTIKNKISSFFGKIGEKIGNFMEHKVKPVWFKVIDFLCKYLGFNWLGKKFRKLTNKTRRAVTGYIFILPFIIGFAFFGIVPIFNSVRMAMADYFGFKGQDIGYVYEGFGFAQFKQIFGENPEHLEAILAVLGDVMLVVPLVLIFSLILSLLLNRKLKGVKIFRMIFFIPVILLSGNLLTYFRNYNLLTVPGIEGGAIQNVLDFYLPEGVSEVIVAAFDKVILILWLSGVQTLIFLAGLQKTNKPVYEADAIDGATKWEMFWKITFPSMLPLMMINIVYTTVVYANLGNELTAFISEASENAIKYGRDYASALSWILFGIELVVIGVYLLILKIANKHYE